MYILGAMRKMQHCKVWWCCHISHDEGSKCSIVREVIHCISVYVTTSTQAPSFMQPTLQLLWHLYLDICFEERIAVHFVPTWKPVSNPGEDPGTLCCFSKHNYAPRMHRSKRAAKKIIHTPFPARVHNITNNAPFTKLSDIRGSIPQSDIWVLSIPCLDYIF